MRKEVGGILRGGACMKEGRWRERWTGRGPDLAAATVVAVFFIFYFRRALFSGEFLLAGDPLYYSYPLRMAAMEMIRQGTLPLWTPFILSGYPLLSMAQLGLGYPLTWAYLFLPGHWAEHLYVLAPYLLAPIFTYFYGREIGRSRLASLLAGLGFGYGGLILSPLGINGMLSNAVMWTPLILIGIERSRTRRFAHCLLLAAFAYSMSVLSGIGQGFVYVGVLVLAYAAFICFTSSHISQSVIDRIKPLSLAVCSIVLAMGVAAFQILETLRAAQSSVRTKLSYEHFSQGSFPFATAWRSVIDPIHFAGDVTTYVPPLILLLALIALIGTIKKDQRDPRIYFWTVTAILAFVLTMGSSTPLYRLVYRIPIINDFRVPSRHSFEWTFAISMMAAFGWDGLQAITRRGRREWLNLGGALVILALCTIAAVRWWKAMKILPYTVIDLHTEYLQWKAGFIILLAIG